MTNEKLVNAYHEAMAAYEAAKTGTGSRVETFAEFLVTEKVLAAHLGKIDQNLEHFRERYSP